MFLKKFNLLFLLFCLFFTNSFSMSIQHGRRPFNITQEEVDYFTTFINNIENEGQTFNPIDYSSKREQIKAFGSEIYTGNIGGYKQLNSVLNVIYEKIKEERQRERITQEAQQPLMEELKKVRGELENLQATIKGGAADLADNVLRQRLIVEQQLNEGALDPGQKAKTLSELILQINLAKRSVRELTNSIAPLGAEIAMNELETLGPEIVNYANEYLQRNSYKDFEDFARKNYIKQMADPDFEFSEDTFNLLREGWIKSMSFAYERSQEALGMNVVELIDQYENYTFASGIVLDKLREEDNKELYNKFLIKLLSIEGEAKVLFLLGRSYVNGERKRNSDILLDKILPIEDEKVFLNIIIGISNLLFNLNDGTQFQKILDNVLYKIIDYEDGIKSISVSVEDDYDEYMTKADIIYKITVSINRKAFSFRKQFGFLSDKLKLLLHLDKQKIENLELIKRRRRQSIINELKKFDRKDRLDEFVEKRIEEIKTLSAREELTIGKRREIEILREEAQKRINYINRPQEERRPQAERRSKTFIQKLKKYLTDEGINLPADYPELNLGVDFRKYRKLSIEDLNNKLLGNDLNNVQKEMINYIIRSKEALPVPGPPPPPPLPAPGPGLAPEQGLIGEIGVNLKGKTLDDLEALLKEKKLELEGTEGLVRIKLRSLIERINSEIESKTQ